jgi:TonB family protein
MRIARLVLLLVSVLLGTASAGKHERAEAEALFARADSLMGLDQPTGGPYTIRGHFRLVLNQPVEGTLLKVVLREPEIWRSEISFPGYSEVVVRNGDRKWVRRNTPFTPRLVKELMAALSPRLKINEREQVETVKEVMLGPTPARCVKVRVKEWGSEVCFDTDTGLPLRKKFWSGRWDQVDYDGYSTAGGKHFPTKIHLSEGDDVVGEFWLDSFSLDVSDKSLFDPLAGAVVWPVCGDKMKPPVPVSTPDPHYTEADRHNRVEGVVVLQVVIDEQGHTHDAVVVRSLTPGLDREAQATVLNWRFKPAMCGSTPAPVEMNIEIRFRL